MNHSFARKCPAGSNPVSIKTSCASGITGRILALAAVLALWLLGHGLCAKWPDPPPGQPEQMRSQANYDPKLADPFFKSEKWSYPWWIIKRADGSIENTFGGPTDEKELPRLKHTARCYTSFQGENWINFCDAKLSNGNTIELFIHDQHAHNLRIVIQSELFWSQYWYYYKARTRLDEGLRWTTKKQELTLDKQVYRKGDVIKGRIVFECAEEVNNPLPSNKFPKIIKIEGVFKTILE
jgi:hypothetical protein